MTGEPGDRRYRFYEIDRSEYPEGDLEPGVHIICGVSLFEGWIASGDDEGRVPIYFDDRIAKAMTANRRRWGRPAVTYHRVFHCIGQDDLRHVLEAIRADLARRIGALAGDLPYEEEPTATPDARSIIVNSFLGNASGVTVNGSLVAGTSISTTATMNPQNTSVEGDQSPSRAARVWRFIVELSGVATFVATAIGTWHRRCGGIFRMARTTALVDHRGPGPVGPT